MGRGREGMGEGDGGRRGLVDHVPWNPPDMPGRPCSTLT